MNILDNLSPSTSLLTDREEAAFDALLHPMLMVLILGACIGLGGAIVNLLDINGTGNATSDLWGWVGMGSVSLAGLFFVRPLALAWIARRRSMNIHLTR